MQFSTLNTIFRHCCCIEIKGNQIFVGQHVYLHFLAAQNSVWFSFTIFYRPVSELLILRLKPRFKQTTLNSWFFPAVPWLNVLQGWYLLLSLALSTSVSLAWRKWSHQERIGIPVKLLQDFQNMSICFPDTYFVPERV